MEISTSRNLHMTTTIDSATCLYCGQPLEPRVLEVCGKVIPAGYEECHCPSSEAARKAAEAEERHKAEVAAVEKHQRKILASGIPSRYRSAAADVDEWTSRIRSGKSVVFTGSAGVGKTFKACATALALIDEMSVCYTSIGRIKSAILSHEMTEAELHRRLAKCGLLLIDDLGKEKPSEWVVGLVYSVINTRYEDERPIIVTTNYTMEELTSKMTIDGDNTTATAIVSRMYEMCGGAPVTLFGGDKRLGRS